METSDWIALSAVFVALCSLGFGYIQWKKARFNEVIKHFLGEKESVAYIAYRICNQGIPGKMRQRKEVLECLFLALVFAHSDRSRALVIQALKQCHKEYPSELESVFTRMVDILEPYNDILDLHRAWRHIGNACHMLNLKLPTQCQQKNDFEPSSQDEPQN